MIILIFCLVLFFYLHIYFQLKTSNDLEVYDIYQQPSREKLEEICDLRQPVIFQFNNEKFIETFTQKMVSETYGAFDVNIRKEKEMYTYTQVELNKALILKETDTEEKIIIENNSDFLEETGLKKNYKYNDTFLRPHMVSECNYDFLTGSKGSYTPLRYDLNYRNYYLVTEGSIRVKLTPPKSTKYLYSVEDYDNFEFRSPINCWNVQDKYVQEFNKVKCVELTVNKGQILFIPAYWWASIRIESPITTVCSFKYKTFMNTISILPRLFLRLLHRHNNIKIALVEELKSIGNPDKLEESTNDKSDDKSEVSTNDKNENNSNEKVDESGRTDTVKT